MEQGRGNVATILVQRGTLNVGDVFVTGDEWGKVRALINDKGKHVHEAGPAQPIEVLGLNGTPNAGDDFIVVSSEARAREVSEYRQRKRREAAAVVSGKGTIEQMFDRMQQDEVKELPVLIKGDVNGSVEAMIGSFEKLTEENEEVRVNVVHSGVGGINESDITLANATGALVIGFNVRAGAQAREIARRDGVDIRYYSVIYNAIDDVKALLGGLLSPEERENITGYAEIRAVFSVPKMGKVAGCYVTEGKIGRGSRVRLLRDDVVVHDGVLGSLRRGKDDVKEVAQGLECGMGFDGYDDIKEGDVIEAYTVQEFAREL
jgi:translation initiation factor IF-2